MTSINGEILIRAAQKENKSRMIGMTKKFFTFLFLFLAGFSVNASISLPKLEPQVTINGQVATATLMFDSNAREELMERLALAKELFEKYKNDPCFRDEVNKKLGKEAADYFTDPDKISDLLINGGAGVLAGAGIGAASKSAKAEQMLQKLGKLMKKMGVGKMQALGPKTRTFRHYGYADDVAKFEGGLRPGSYATHARGRPMHGTTAQQKLALPHEAPPNAYYKVRVCPDVPVKGPGAVPSTQVPIRHGGGIEYTFPKGTPPGSIEGPFPIP